MAEPINKTQLLDIKDLLGDELERMIQTFIDESPAHMRIIQFACDGAENSSAKTAISSLKGASTNLGATELASLCQKLLLACKENCLQHSDVLVDATEKELQRVILFLQQEVA